MDYIYLHGFASGPQSAKAQYLCDRFAEFQINLKTPDLNQSNFFHLTITRQISQVRGELSSPVTLIGSSLGGLTAAWLGEQHLQIQRLVLLAPAFGFLYHWLSQRSDGGSSSGCVEQAQLGEEKLKQWQQAQYLMVYHYGEKRSLPLSYDFVLDAAQYQDKQLLRPIPTLILHGRKDEVIPIRVSRDFAAQRSWVQLIELSSDHGLGDVLPEIWQAVQVFCRLH